MTSLLAFDIAVMQLAHAHRLPALDVFFLWLTHLGDARVVTVVALGMAFVLWRHRRFEYKAGLALSIFGSLAASHGIKVLIERARPGAPFSLLDVA